MFWLKSNIITCCNHRCDNRNKGFVKSFKERSKAEGSRKIENLQRGEKREPAFQLVDNRREAVAQRRLRNVINGSSKLDQSANLEQKTGGVGVFQRVYDPSTGEFAGERPKKPGSLKGEDEGGQSLTAHHIYPWNKIRSDLNTALTSKSKPKMEAILHFAGTAVSDSFWVDLAKEPADRSAGFASEVNRIAKAACWSKGNVFMGPLGEYRSDDPGEEMDTSFSKSGIPTPASAVGDLINQSGGIGGTERKSSLARMLARNVREASGGKEEAYDSTKWKSTPGFIGKGAKKRAATIRSRMGRVPNPYASEGE